MTTSPRPSVRHLPGDARRPRTAALAALCLLLPAAAVQGAALPYDFDHTPGHLPKAVRPLEYHLDLEADIEALQLQGRAAIDLEFRQASSALVFNAVGLTLQDVRVDGQPVSAVQADAEHQEVQVQLAAALPPGHHQLTLRWQGPIASGPPGVFAQHFRKPDGSQDVLLSTKFEPTHARRLFPCWDEPAFRAAYTLSFSGPASWAVVANMPVARQTRSGGRATTWFATTPPMPSYLVQLSAGDLAALEARSGDTRLGVWAVRGQEQEGARALAWSQQILADYNDYFGYPYPLPKLDQIAIPGGFTGAMENWGAITYNDQLLLLNEASTLAGRQRGFSVIAHEMAHQWNGDLVTMGWWDDLWLNESFASWRAAKETDARNPDWNWWELEDAAKERAMRADAQASSHAIEQHVVNDTQAQAAFDPEITYDKGQSVLRMLEAYLGEQTFRAGIRRYMQRHALSNASSADLWQALNAASGRDVAAIATAWTDQAGFPLVRVATQCAADGGRTVRLAQQRFLLEGADSSGARWRIPLQIRSAAAPVQTALLEADGLTLAAGRCGEPLSLDAGALGFYRVEYDAATLADNRAHFADLPRADRIALLDDQWALVEAGRQPLGSYLALVEAMPPDLQERAWEQISEVLGTLEFAEREGPGHAAFTAYARSLLGPLAARLGWDPRPEDTAGTQKLRRTVLADLGAWGDPAVIAEARRRFQSFRADPAALGPDDQELVLGIVAQHADAPTFATLHALARATRGETELRRHYLALMKVQDPLLAQEAAQIALSDEIPPQAAAFRLSLVAALNERNPRLAWQTLRDHVEAVMAPQGQYRSLILAQRLPKSFWASAPLDELEAWVKSQVPAALAPNLARGMEAARFRLAERTRLVAATDDWLTRAERPR